ncbi:MAG TPA: hypothetical protein DCY00_08240 [Actinobacteria bacterium]|nr:hypothetical protein [Actinomycetota bacterium]
MINRIFSDNKIKDYGKIFILIFYLLFIFIMSACCSKNTDKLDRISSEIYSEIDLPKPLPLKNFKSDGCSCFPDGNWIECCIKHDIYYWMGGTRQERLEADRELRKCVSEKGYKITGFLMYYGVRAGGVWWLPTSFRWGFGWEYPQSGPLNKPY